MPSSSNLIGHKEQIQSLVADLEADNVAHAYLFAGQKHLGKFTIAKWFAKKLLTIDAEGPDEQKRLAHEVDRLIHPDLLVIDQLWIEDVCEDFEVIARTSNVPQQERAKKGAKTDTISIDDIRALQERLHEVGGGRYRCCLIRSVERMQDEAVNALLKILEEPPAGVVFLLTSESASLLLPTLVSRARVLRFFPLPARDLHTLLQSVPVRPDDRPGGPQDDAQFLLRLAQGAPGVVLRMKGDPDSLRAERQRHAQAAAFWHAQSLAERLKLLEPLAERGDDAQRYLLHLAIALREEREDAAGLQGEVQVDALRELVRDLQTNASRPLLVQRFALAVSGL